MRSVDLQCEGGGVMPAGMDLEGGRSMEWFFEEWVRGTGIPHYRVEFTAHQTEKGYQIRGKLLQTGVPRSFVASVPLYAGGFRHKTLFGSGVTARPETTFPLLAPTSPRKNIIYPPLTALFTSRECSHPFT